MVGEDIFQGHPEHSKYRLRMVSIPYVLEAEDPWWTLLVRALTGVRRASRLKAENRRTLDRLIRIEVVDQ